MRRAFLSSQLPRETVPEGARVVNGAEPLDAFQLPLHPLARLLQRHQLPHHAGRQLGRRSTDRRKAQSPPDPPFANSAAAPMPRHRPAEKGQLVKRTSALREVVADDQLFQAGKKADCAADVGAAEAALLQREPRQLRHEQHIPYVRTVAACARAQCKSRSRLLYTSYRFAGQFAFAGVAVTCAQQDETSSLCLLICEVEKKYRIIESQ